MSFLKSFLRDERGQDMVEYGLLAAFISIVAIGVLTQIGPAINTVFTNILNALN